LVQEKMKDIFNSKLFTNSELVNHGLLDNVSLFDANWMFLSLGFGVLLFLWLLFSPRWSGSIKEKLHDPKWLGYLVIFLYSIHQFEEHGFDIFGRRYMFVPVFDASIILDPALGIQLLPRAVTLINVLLIWGALLLWAKMSKPENSYYLVTMSWGFAAVNGIVGHLLPIITQTGELRYMPGAFQSIFMVPLGIYILLKVFKQLGTFKGFVLPLIFGFIFHVTGLIFPLLFVQIYFTWIPQEIILPMFIGITALIPILAMPLLKKYLNLKPWKGNTTGIQK